jgi:hypothetical protein
LWILTYAQRRALNAQIMRNVINPGTDLAAARLAASGMTDRRWVGCLVAGLLMWTTGNALINPSLVQFVVVGVMAFSFGLGFVLTTRESRRAEVFLRDHPLPES